MLYRPCPNCGSNLDPGERCDCAENARRAEPMEIISRKGVMENVSNNDKSRPDLPPRGKTGGRICEPRHGIDRSAVLA